MQIIYDPAAQPTNMRFKAWSNPQGREYALNVELASLTNTAFTNGSTWMASAAGSS